MALKRPWHLTQGREVPLAHQALKWLWLSTQRYAPTRFITYSKTTQRYTSAHTLKHQNPSEAHGGCYATRRTPATNSSNEPMTKRHDCYLNIYSWGSRRRNPSMRIRAWPLTRSLPLSAATISKSPPAQRFPMDPVRAHTCQMEWWGTRGASWREGARMGRVGRGEERRGR